MGKLKTFSKGDVIRTNPEEGFYGIAVVLSDGKQLEVAPGKMSYPIKHLTALRVFHNEQIEKIPALPRACTGIRAFGMLL